MEIEEYFADAIEMGRLAHNYYMADPYERHAAGLAMQSCKYFTRLSALQSMSGLEFMNKLPTSQIVNAGKVEFFINTAVPHTDAVDKESIKRLPYHRHDYLELVVILRGGYTQVINGKVYSHSAGDICMMNPNIVHRDIAPDKGDRVVYLCIGESLMQGEMRAALQEHNDLREFLKYKSGRTTYQFVKFHPRDFEQKQELIIQILREDKDKLAGHHAIIKGLLVRLFSRMIKDGEYEIVCQSTQEIEENLIAEMLQYMHEHMADITRRDMASFFHFNPDYLNRMLTRATTQNYTDKLREMRLAAAERQLRETNKSVALISQEVGFSNKRYFNQIFLKKYGFLPGAYRKNKT